MDERSRVNQLLRRHGLRSTKGLGQHFLVDGEVLRQVAGAVVPGVSTTVIEVGAGIGNLTYLLALSGAHVIGIEIDPKFRPLHEETFLHRETLQGTVEFVYVDALEFDFADASRQAAERGRRFVVAGNIPYQITSPLIMRILESGACFDVMALMMQREVAERLTSGPGTRRNSAITIKVQYFCEPDIVCEVPAAAFLPPPKVDSQVIAFRLRSPRLSDTSREAFFRLVDAAFAQRRKMMVNSVVAAGGGYGRPEIEAALERIGLSPAVRAEQLGCEEFLALFGALCET